MAFEKFKTALSLFFQSCAFFVVFFMLMRLGLQTVHHAPVIHSALVPVTPIEMRASSDLEDPSYLKPDTQRFFKTPWNENSYFEEVNENVKIPAHQADKDVKVLVKKRVQDGLPLVSVRISKTFEVENEVQKKKDEESALTEKEEETSVFEKPFTIQLVTYRSEARAQEEVLNLKEAGYNSFIIPSGEFFQVCINRFKEKEVALQALNKLKNIRDFYSYQDAYVRAVIR